MTWLLWQGLGLAIGATLMDLKKATTLASVTIMTFMLAGGFFVEVSLHLPNVQKPLNLLLIEIWPEN